jgi:septal ring factor EnvC (AmiA/AmiB activator)
MGWFRKRQDDERQASAESNARMIHELRTEVAELGKQFRKLREEVAEDMERAYRHRKAAEARNRAAASPESPTPDQVAAPVTPPPGMRPVHLRRWLAKQRQTNGADHGLSS